MHKFIAPVLALMAVLGLSVPAVHAATFSILNTGGAKLVLNPDGTIDSQYPTGNKNPSVPTLTCDWTGFPALTGLVTGNAFSSSARAKLAGTAAATATLAVIASGTGSVGAWAISGNNLVHDGVSIGAGSLRVTATTNGVDTVNCSTVSWSYVAPPSTDTTAPTIPTGLRQTASGTNTIDIEVEASSDPCGTAACDGVSSYNIKKDGTTVTTQAASLGLQSSLTTANIGSGSGTHTCTQSGTGWTVVGAGTGLDGTADGAVSCGTNIAGTYSFITACVSSQTFAADPQYHKIGIEFRATNAANSAAFTLHSMRTASTVYYAQASARSGTGVARQNIGQQEFTSPRCLKIEKSSNLFSAYTSPDGGVWTPLVSNYSLTLPATYYGGLVGTATTAGTSATGVLINVNVNNVAKLAKTVSTTTAGTFTVTAVDGSSNESSASIGITGTPSAPPSAEAIKWHPGHYAWLDTCKSTSVSRADHMAFLDSIEDDPDIKGILVCFYWGDLEAAHGDYTAGFAIVDQYVQKAESVGKQVMIRVYDRVFGGLAPSNLNNGHYFPSYLKVAPYEGYFSTSGGTVLHTLVKLWEQNNMTAFIELGQAYAARYNTNSAFEMWGIEETSINFGTNGVSTSGYTDAKYVAQWTRWIPAMRTAWANTGVRFQLNYFISAFAESGGLVELARQNAVAVGGPDTTPVNTLCGWDWGDIWYMGHNPPPNCQTLSQRNTALPQYIGKMPMVAESQDYGLTTLTRDQGKTLTQIQAGAIERGAQYIIWYVNSFSYTQWTTTGGINDNEAILPFIHSINGAVYSATCPISYPSCDTSALIEPDLFILHIDEQAANDGLYDVRRAA